MSTDAVHVRSLDRTLAARDTSRVRESFFVILMALLFLSLLSLFVGKNLFRYYKYLCWATLAISLAVAGFTCCVRQPPTIGISIAIFFGFLGYVTVGVAQLSTGNSYGSALIPFSVCTLGYLTTGTGRQEVQRYVTLTYIACGIVLVAAIVAPMDTFFLIHVFSFVLVFGLVFALVLRHRLAAVAILFVIAFTLVRRPSSTLFAGALMGITMAMCLGSWPKSGSIVARIVIGLFGIMALVSMSDPDLAFVVGDLESYVKEAILGGESNSSARAALIVGTQQIFAKGSFFFGNYFAADSAAEVSDILGRLDFSAPVHSDFVQILYRGGLVSLVAFCYFLGELSLLHRKRENSPEYDFFRRAVPICTAVFAFYISFNPIMLNIEYSLWFFMLSFICLGFRAESHTAHANQSR